MEEKWTVKCGPLLTDMDVALLGITMSKSTFGLCACIPTTFLVGLGLCAVFACFTLYNFMVSEFCDLA